MQQLVLELLLGEGFRSYTKSGEVGTSNGCNSASNLIADKAKKKFL